MKWYMIYSLVSLETGGKTPLASQVKKMMFLGWPPMAGSFTPGMASNG